LHGSGEAVKIRRRARRSGGFIHIEGTMTTEASAIRAGAPRPAGMAPASRRWHGWGQAISAILVVLAVVLIGACRSTDPVYSVEQAPLSPPPKATMADIQRAIIRAGASRGWVMTPKEPGLIQATYSRQGHSATVDIRYSLSAYSISYVDSQNLHYDGTTIHPRYNAWIRYLQTDIQNQVAAI
jgi:hypothetical protein